MHRRAYLLLESLIALFLTSTVILSWFSFIRAYSAVNPAKDLDAFFQTKKLLIQSLHHEELSQTSNKYIRFDIQRKKIDKKLTQVIVNCFVNEKLRFSLTGVTK